MCLCFHGPWRVLSRFRTTTTMGTRCCSGTLLLQILRPAHRRVLLEFLMRNLCMSISASAARIVSSRNRFELLPLDQALSRCVTVSKCLPPATINTHPVSTMVCGMPTCEAADRASKASVYLSWPVEANSTDLSLTAGCLIRVPALSSLALSRCECDIGKACC